MTLETLNALEEIALPGEQWAPHPEYPDFYGSTEGRVASWVERYGRLKVLSYKGKLELTRGTRGGDYQRRQFSRQRFIWECFNGVERDKRQIVYLNRDRTDCRLANLALLTPSRRVRHYAK